MRRARYGFFVSMLAVIVMGCFASTMAAATETLQAAENIQSDIARALLSKQFALLNVTVDGFTKSRDRLPDGRWKLTFVIGGFTRDLREHDERAWQDRLQLIDTWIAATPRNATPYLAKADFLTAYAWDARGTGPAGAVKDNDWPIFRQRIAQAREVLERAAPIAKHSPLWYESMQAIATAQAWPEDDFLRLFREGTTTEPTYYPLYFSAANYLLPRWHGSAEQLSEFVNNAVLTTEQSEGQALYARIYWSLLWALKDRTFAPGYANWVRMRQGFEDIVRIYPDNWNLNAFAYYACMAHDWQTAKVIAARMTSVVDGLWKGMSRYKWCMRKASQENGSAGT